MGEDEDAPRSRHLGDRFSPVDLQIMIDLYVSGGTARQVAESVATYSRATSRSTLSWWRGALLATSLACWMHHLPDLPHPVADRFRLIRLGRAIQPVQRNQEAVSTINARYAADWTDSAPLLAAALVSHASLVPTT